MSDRRLKARLINVLRVFGDVYWLLTTDLETLPDNSITFVMVAAPAIELNQIGDSYGFRTSIEYGLGQAKDALAWADFRMTCYD